MTLREELIELWDKLEFGVKTRVFEVHSRQKIEYIRKTPNYSEESVIKEIIECIKEKALEVKEEVNEMYNAITG